MSIITQPTTPSTLQPNQAYVKKRCGKLAELNTKKIHTAMKKAFLATDKTYTQQSQKLQDKLDQFTQQVNLLITRRLRDSQVIEIETIQDLVELTLMREGEHQVARSYVLYREQRRQNRTQTDRSNNITDHMRVHVNMDNNQTTELTLEWLSTMVRQACEQWPDTDPNLIIDDTKRNLFDGMTISNVYKAMTLSARTLIETNPNYTYVTANLLRQQLFKETQPCLQLTKIEPNSQKNIQSIYHDAFLAFIAKGIDAELLHPNLNDFDLPRLAAHIKPERDEQFTYLALQTLYDRYLIHCQGTRIELPQVMFMRVAMGLAHSENEQRNEYAIQFYDLLSSFDYMTSHTNPI